MKLSMMKRGYTLVEVMITITIMGILVSIAIGAAGAAKSTARDNERISEMRLLQLKLEAFRSDNGNYPADLYELVPNYLPEVPADSRGPESDLQYMYAGITIANAENVCLGYHLGAYLEKNNAILTSDTDADGIGNKPSCINGSIESAADFDGREDEEAGIFIYDVVNP